MKYLQLDAQMYEILYGNALRTENPIGEAKVRLLAKIQDKIESLGKLQDDATYKWNEDAKTLVLEDAEYKLLQEINSSIQFNSRFARIAVKYLDWFANASDKPPLVVTHDSVEAVEASSH